VPWKASTLAGPGVVQPSITAPVNNATGINPTAAGTPYGVTLTGSAYATTGGAGAHTSSDWGLYAAIPYQPETTGTINNVQTVGTATTNPMANWTGSLAIQSVQRDADTIPCAAKGDTEWVIGYDGSYVYSTMRSTDGINWSATNPAFVNDGVSSLAFGNGRYVAGGPSKFSHSDDGGMLWTEQAAISPAPGDIRWVRFGGGQFVAYGLTTRKSYTSPDGVTWTGRNVAGNNLTDAYYANSLWVSVGGAGTTPVIATSSDGQTWTAQTAGVAQALKGVTYGNGLWVAVGDNNTILTSPDAINWTPRTSPAAATDDFVNVAFGDGYFVVGLNTAGPAFVYSQDGITWTSITRGVAKVATSEVSYIYYGDGMFVGAGPVNTGNITASVASYLTLTFTSNAGFSNFSVGDPVITITGSGKGSIKAIRSATNQLDVQISSGNWNVGAKLKLASTGKLKVGSAPATSPPDPAQYAQIVNVAGDTSNLTSYFVGVSSLSPNTTYYAQVSYTSSDPLTSPPSAWSKFTTARTFASNATSGSIAAITGGPYSNLGNNFFSPYNSTSTTPTQTLVSNPTTVSRGGGNYGVSGVIVDDLGIYAEVYASFGGLTTPYRPKYSDAALAFPQDEIQALIINATSGCPTISNNLSSTYRLALPPGVNVLNAGFPQLIGSQTPFCWVTLTNGDLYFWGTGTIGSPSPAGSNWRQVPYTFPAGGKITKVAALGTSSAKVVALTDAGNLYVVGTNGAAADFGFPDTGTWTVPTQITGISNVVDIQPFPRGGGLSAVTSTGNLWVGCVALQNFNTTEFTFQLIGTGYISPVFGFLPTSSTRWANVFAAKTDGFLYTKNTPFTGGGTDVFTLNAVDGGVTRVPNYNLGIIGKSFQAQSSIGSAWIM